jgi:hypothetical protein
MTPSSLVAIHQPNFFPWLGFFDKLRRCDTFVLLDNVQFPRTGAGNPLNRVRILVSGAPQWITAPVRRLGTGQPIREVLVNDERDWRSKIIKTLQMNYGRAPGFAASMPLLEDLLGYQSSRLAEYNQHAIHRLSSELGLAHASIVRASELDVSGSSTRLLIDIVRAVGGTAYLAGDGAEGYQEDELFARAGIELVRQRFEHPSYPQPLDEPAAGLSVIDALMQCGPDGASALLSR